MSITFLPVNPVNNGLDVATEVTRRLSQMLPDSAGTIYTALVAAAVETAFRRGYRINKALATVTFHCPLEQVARACHMSRQTVWRHLPALKELGLVDFRTHKGSLFGETRNTGTLFQVKLNPVRGSRAKLTNEELRHKWRDLEADYKRYRLSSLTLKRQIVTHTKAFPNIDLILAWSAPSLNPVTGKNLVKTVCSKRLECVLDTVSAPREDRNNMVALAADALATALADAGSVSWYQKLLWQLLRRFDATGEDFSYQVYLAAQRAVTDRTEGFARRAGGLFQSRLKTAAWFDPVMNAPPVRVGTKPLKA